MTSTPRQPLHMGAQLSIVAAKRDAQAKRDKAGPRRMRADADTERAMAQHQGETPTHERARMSGADRTDAGRIEAKLGAGCMVLRLRDAWPPATLHKRGLLTRRQLAAAERLVELYEGSRIERVGAQSWDMPTDGGGYSNAGQPPRVVRFRRDYFAALAAMPAQARPYVVAVVIAGRTIETATRDAPTLFRAGSLRRRTPAGVALLGASLDAAARVLGV